MQIVDSLQPSLKQVLAESNILVSLLPALIASGIVGLLLSALTQIMMISNLVLITAKLEVWLVSWAILFPLCFVATQLLKKLPLCVKK